MPLIPGTVVTSGLSPGNALNTHETHRAFYGKGGYRTVTTTTARNQITPLRREEGMLVFVISDNTIYKLKSGAPVSGNTSDSDWEVLSIGGGITVITGVIPAAGSLDLVIGPIATFAIDKYLMSLVTTSKAYGEEILISKDHTNTDTPGFSLVEYAVLGDMLYTALLVIVGPDLVLRVTNNELLPVTYTFKM